MNININADLKALKKDLTRLQQKQIPFAAAGAINDTLYQLKGEEAWHAKKQLDRPTPFTLRGFKYTKANKKNLEGVFYIDDIQAKYLGYQIKGGVRRPKRKSVLVPTKIMRRNKYGNVPGWRTKFSTLKDREGYFSGEIKGVAGLWRVYRSKKRAPKLMIAYEERAVYKPRFDYYAVARKHINVAFRSNLNRTLTKALATAR